MATKKINKSNDVIINESENTQEGIKRFCSECGTQFMAANKMVRFCPTCAEKHKQELKEKQKGYAKERTARLGLTNVSIYKTDKEKLVKMAQEKGIILAEVLKELLADK